DCNRHFLDSLEKEPINSLYKQLFQASRLPNFLRPLLARLMRLFGERRTAHVVLSVGSKTAYEYFDLIIDMQKYVQKWLDDLKSNNIDLLLVSNNRTS
ncbi:unnamed protein product, partial [Rotaria magnacalcarata]